MILRPAHPLSRASAKPEKDSQTSVGRCAMLFQVVQISFKDG